MLDTAMGIEASADALAQLGSGMSTVASVPEQLDDGAVAVVLAGVAYVVGEARAQLTGLSSQTARPLLEALGGVGASLEFRPRRRLRPPETAAAFSPLVAELGAAVLDAAVCGETVPPSLGRPHARRRRPSSARSTACSRHCCRRTAPASRRRACRSRSSARAPPRAARTATKPSTWCATGSTLPTSASALRRRRMRRRRAGRARRCAPRSARSTRAWPTLPWSLGQFTSLSASESRLRALQEVEEAEADTSQGDRVALFIDLVAEREEHAAAAGGGARVGVPLLSTGAAQAAQRSTSGSRRSGQVRPVPRKTAAPPSSPAGTCALPDRRARAVQWAGAWRSAAGPSMAARRSAASARCRRSTPPARARQRHTLGGRRRRRRWLRPVPLRRQDRRRVRRVRRQPSCAGCDGVP